MEITKQYQIKMMPLAELDVDMSYQRITAEKRVKKLVRDFTMQAIGLIVINLREDGTYILVDGQHRVEAARIKSITSLPAQVYKHLTLQEEAWLYMQFQNNRTLPKPVERFKAAIIAEEPVTMAILDVLEKYSVKPNLISQNTAKNRQKGYVSCLRPFTELYQVGMLSRVLEIISKSWSKQDGPSIVWDPQALHSDVLMGFKTFMHRTKGNFDDERLIKRLADTGAMSLLKQQDANRIIFRTGRNVCFARVLVEIYNYALHTRNKLDIKL